MRAHKLVLVCALVLSVVAAGCGYYRIVPKAEDPARLAVAPPMEIRTPAKAHLKDGSVVLFADGFHVERGVIRGNGEKYDLTRKSRTAVYELPLNDVAALEHYEKSLRGVVSTLATIPVAVLGAAATAGLLVALFGSCPTIYSVDGARLLNAELFSHSISRRFEGDDLDRLSGLQLRDGGYRLQIANEALETHYINRLALEIVDHPTVSRAYPTPQGGVVVVSGESPVSARSSQDEDVTAELAASDGTVYRSDPELTRGLTRSINEDWVELTAPVPTGLPMRRPILAMRLRNTLMATVLLYDVMLKGQGVKALEWLSSDSMTPLSDWQMYRWFKRNYGLRVQVWDGDRFVTAASLSPTGPIAWHDVALELPQARGPEVRIRISFLPDNWMLDRAAVGFDTARPLAKSSIAAVRLDNLSNELAEAGLASLRAKDGNYFVTTPGESHTLFFPSEAPAADTERTLFLRSRGFYIEWLREDWFNDAQQTRAASSFDPGDQAVLRTARVWLQKKDDMERRFTETKIPLAGDGQ